VDQGNNGLSRGDRNRNARLAALRAVLPRDHAILGIDLAQSRQAAVLADHDSRVLARWRPRCSPWMLGELLDRALRKALAAGYAGITVACEPTGHRWMVISQLAAERGMAMVCVQPLVVARAREAEDYTRGKNDDRDAVLIARLAAQLHCYSPEQADQEWARLRHFGTRRSRLIEASTMYVQQLRDLLEVAWPAVLPTAADPLESATWLACLSAALERGDGDLGAVHAMGQDAFTAAARGGLGAWGARRICRRIAVAVYAALADSAGVAAQRPGALERAFSVLGDWKTVRGELAGVNARMLQPWTRWASWRWPARSRECRRCRSPRSWPRPATHPGSPLPARWSSTRAWHPARTPAATTPARPPSPAAADPRCGWPPGARSGARCATTRSTPPGTPA